jgi:hypothetical protein
MVTYLGSAIITVRPTSDALAVARTEIVIGETFGGVTSHGV